MVPDSFSLSLVAVFVDPFSDKLTLRIHPNIHATIAAAADISGINPAIKDGIPAVAKRRAGIQNPIERTGFPPE
jgi:hypothetical protein